jgi:hypothetical protein
LKLIDKSMVVAQFVAGLTILMMAVAQAEQPLIDFSYTCINLPSLPNLDVPTPCLELKLDACGEVGVKVNFTLGGESVLFIDEKDELDRTETCTWLTDSKTCEECIGFRSLTLRPNYAEVCPRLTLKCYFSNGVMFPFFPQEQWTEDCLVLGADCTDQTTCGSCTSTDGCGWCNEDKKCKTVDFIDEAEVHCGDKCQKASWYTNQCNSAADGANIPANPIKKAGDDDDDDDGALIVVLVILGLIFLILGAWWLRRRANRSNSKGSYSGRNGDHLASPVEIQDETGFDDNVLVPDGAPSDTADEQFAAREGAAVPKFHV